MPGAATTDTVWIMNTTPTGRPRTVTATAVLQSAIAGIALLLLAVTWWSYVDFAGLVDSALRMVPEADAEQVAARRRYNLGTALTFTVLAGFLLLWAAGTLRPLLRRHNGGRLAATAGAGLTVLIGLSFCGGLNDGLLALWRGPRSGDAPADAFSVALEQAATAGFVGGDATYLLAVVVMPLAALLALAALVLLLTPTTRRWYATATATATAGPAGAQAQPSDTER